MMHSGDDLVSTPTSSIRSLHDVQPLDPIVQNFQTCNLNPSASNSAQLDTNQRLQVGFNESSNTKKFKVIFLGESGVGKSSIMLRLCEDRFTEYGIATCGLDISTVEVTVENETIIISLWDTGGQERHHAISASYMRQADGIIMVYDVTNEESFLALRRRWFDRIKEVREEINQKIVVLLVGNKIDMSPKKVQSTVGQQFAAELQAPFFEMSAKSGEGAEEAHKKLAKLLIQNEIDKLTKLMRSLDKIEKPKNTRRRKPCSNC